MGEDKKMTYEEQKAYSRKYYREHIDKYKAYQKKYRKEHKQELRAYKKKYYEMKLKRK